MSIDTSMAEARNQEIIKSITEDQFEAERKWENAMYERGRQKYMRIVNDAKQKNIESTTDYGMVLIKKAFANTYDALAQYMENVKSGHATNIPVAYKYLRNLDLEVVTFISLRKLFDQLTLKKPIQNVATAIANELMFEAKMHSLKADDPSRWTKTQSYLKHSSSRKYKSTVLTFALGKSSFATFQPWPAMDRHQIGMKLIDIMYKSTGLIDIYMDNEGIRHKKGFYKIGFTDKASKWIARFCEYSEYSDPDLYPTLIPPKPWTGAFDGGHWFPKENCRTIPFIKTRDIEYLSAVDSLMRSGHLEEVRNAINTIQNTAWTVNTKVLEVAQTVWDAGGGRGVLPDHDDKHLPLCPVCGKDITEEANAHIKHPCLDELKEHNREAFDKWKSAAKDIRNLNATLQGQRIGVVKALSMARIMSKHDKFYFPYQLDFRGRIYVGCSYLSPQGTDLGKALLKFAEAKPLGTMDAVKWLAVHVANTYGEDKISLDDRYSWVIQHQSKILAVAEDPYENDYWMDADEPFCFLAACFEWAGYVKEGLAYKSSLPVAMDGSCNGLQIFSLMLHDEVGGASVNLVPSDKPSDIYGIVAQKVIDRLTKEAQDKSLDVDVETPSGQIRNVYRDAQALLLMHITRKTTKRQVMTTPYGAKMMSCTTYTRKWMLEQEGFDWSSNRQEFRRLSFILSDYIHKAIGDTVIKAKEAMAYLQGMARALCKIGKPIYWVTPCGLPIKQMAVNYKCRTVRTTIGDRIVKLRVQGEDVDHIDREKQANSISPNFVHSLDATALMKTVCGCTNENIWNFALIHDSYGTHAADSPKLARILRESFIQMFGGSADLLKDFEDNLIRQYPELANVKGGLPTRPEFGTLNVEDVRNSLYFFA